MNATEKSCVVENVHSDFMMTDGVTSDVLYLIKSFLAMNDVPNALTAA
jgi:hypothetical protein